MTENSWDISEAVRNGNYSISIDSVVNGKLQKLIDKGLKVMALCNDGTGRSHKVARELTRQGIPSVSLAEGLKTVDRDHHLFPYLINEINNVPNVVIILTPEEMKLFNGILQNLRAYRFSSSNSAIESLSKMIG